MPWSIRGFGMSEAVTVAPRSKAGRAISAVLPGAPQLVDGRWGTGATALLVWVSCLGLLLTRPGRVVDAFGGAWDERLAAGRGVVRVEELKIDVSLRSRIHLCLRLPDNHVVSCRVAGDLRIALHGVLVRVDDELALGECGGGKNDQETKNK